MLFRSVVYFSPATDVHNIALFDRKFLSFRSGFLLFLIAGLGVLRSSFTFALQYTSFAFRNCKSLTVRIEEVVNARPGNILIVRVYLLNLSRRSFQRLGRVTFTGKHR